MTPEEDWLEEQNDRTKLLRHIVRQLGAVREGQAAILLRIEQAEEKLRDTVEYES